MYEAGAGIRGWFVLVVVWLVALTGLACTGTTQTIYGSDGDGSSEPEDGDGNLPDGDEPGVDGDEELPPDGDGSPDGDGGEEPDEVDLCGVGDDTKTPGAGPASLSDAINPKVFNGTESPSLFNISASQQLAVGALVGNMGWGGGLRNFCTGTLIAPRVVLTASHCLEGISSPASVKFVIGRDARNPDATFDVESFAINPKYSQYSFVPAAHDTAVMILTESVYDRVAELRPIPANDRALETSLIGQMVQNVGYGATQNNENNSLKWWIPERVDSVGRGEITVNGLGQGAVCFGDSGGPALYDFGDGLRVIGTVSWGDENCTGIDHFADVQNDFAWIKGFLDAAGGCGDTDEVGRCVEGRAIYCKNDDLVEDTCKAGRDICDLDELNRYRCVADPCKGVTFEGHCEDGDVAVWCENRTIRRRHCLPCQQTCGWAGEVLGYYCVDEAATGRCGNVTSAGCCAAGKAFWCDDAADILHSQDCGGDSCGWNAGSGGYFCGSSGADPSGTNPLECVSR